MFPITVTINTAAQLNAVMAVLNIAGIGSPGSASCAGHAAESAKEETRGRNATARKTEVKKPEAGTTTSPTIEQQPEAPAGTNAAETRNTPHSHTGNQADAATYQDAAHAITRLARAKGRDAAVAVLAQFGAARLPDVEPEQFAGIVAACEAAGA